MREQVRHGLLVRERLALAVPACVPAGEAVALAGERVRGQCLSPVVRVALVGHGSCAAVRVEPDFVDGGPVLGRVHGVALDRLRWVLVPAGEHVAVAGDAVVRGRVHLGQLHVFCEQLAVAFIVVAVDLKPCFNIVVFGRSRVSVIYAIGLPLLATVPFHVGFAIADFMPSDTDLTVGLRCVTLKLDVDHPVKRLLRRAVQVAGAGDEAILRELERTAIPIGLMPSVHVVEVHVRIGQPCRIGQRGHGRRGPVPGRARRDGPALPVPELRLICVRLPPRVQGQGVALGRVCDIGASLVGGAGAVGLGVPAGERVALAQEDAGLGGRGRGAGVPDLRERVAVSAVRIVSDGGLASADGGVKGLRGQGPAPVRVFRSPRLDGYPVGNAFVLETDAEGRLRRLPYVPGVPLELQGRGVGAVGRLQRIGQSGKSGSDVVGDVP